MCLIREFKIPVDRCYLWSAKKDVYLNSHKIGSRQNPSFYFLPLAKSLYESNICITETLTCKIFKAMISQLFSTCKSLHKKRSRHKWPFMQIFSCNQWSELYSLHSIWHPICNIWPLILLSDLHFAFFGRDYSEEDCNVTGKVSLSSCVAHYTSNGRTRHQTETQSSW